MSGEIFQCELRPDSVGAEYIELSPATASPPIAPLFALGTASRELFRFYYGQHATLSVGCYRLRDIGVTSHGILIQNGVPITCNQLNLNAGSFEVVRRYGPLRLGDEISRRVPEPTVLLVGPGYLVYGHWLTDFLPKLYILAKMGMDLAKLKYFIPIDTPEFAVKWLSLLGIERDNLIRFSPYEETVGAAELLVPTLLRTNSRAAPIFRNAAEFIFSRIQLLHPGAVRADGPARIFLSRAETRRSRRLANRKAIERMAVQEGFTLVAPETLSLLDQVSLFRSARQIIGEYGSALHGSIFSLPGAIVCALRGGAYHPGFLQSGLCQTMQQEIAYLFGKLPVEQVEQNFAIEEDDFRLCLRLLSLFESGGHRSAAQTREADRALSGRGILAGAAEAAVELRRKLSAWGRR
jgi:capsular polysaccharide biosynthesis protein